MCYMSFFFLIFILLSELQEVIPCGCLDCLRTRVYFLERKWCGILRVWCCLFRFLWFCCAVVGWHVAGKWLLGEMLGISLAGFGVSRMRGECAY